MLRNIPKRNKQVSVLLSLALVIGLAFLLRGVQTNTENRQHAQVPNSYPPEPTQPPSNGNEKIWWATRNARFTAEDFYIRIGSTYFYGKPAYVHSYVSSTTQNVEAQWQENGQDMHVTLTFYNRGTDLWDITDVITNSNGKSINYKMSQHSDIGNRVGYQASVPSEKFIPIQAGVDAEIYCTACTFYPFIPPDIGIFTSGYSLEAPTGLPIDKVVTIPPDPNTGFGINVILRNSQGVEVFPSNMRYDWHSDNPTIARASGSSQHGDIQGLSWGVANIRVLAVQTTDNRVLASTSFPVHVSEGTNYDEILNTKKPDCAIAAYADSAQNAPPNYFLTQKINSISPGQRFVIASNFFNHTGKEYQNASNHITLSKYLKFVDSNGSDCNIDTNSTTVVCDHGAFLNNGATSVAMRVKYVGASVAPVSIFGTTFGSNGDTGSCSTSLNNISVTP